MESTYLSLKPTDWIAISSVLIAACALVTAIWQGIIARQHARLSAKPIIEAEVNSHEKATLSIRNSGLGPALLTEINGKYLAVSYNLTSSAEILKLIDALIPDPSIRLSVRTLIPSPNSTLAAGESISILSAQSEGWPELSRKLANVFSKVELAVKYEDIYGKSFTCTHSFGANV